MAVAVAEEAVVEDWDAGEGMEVSQRNALSMVMPLKRPSGKSSPNMSGLLRPRISAKTTREKTLPSL